MFRILAAAALAAACIVPASAQTPPPALNLSGPATGWVKVCQGNAQSRGGCVISNEMYSDQGSALGSIGIQETAGDRRRRLVMIVPHGMWIEDGVQFRVDGNPPVTSPYGTCLVNGCFAALDLTDALLQQMRRGRQVILTVKEPSQRPVNIALSLEQFATVYDGAPMDADAVAQRTRTFQEEMRRRQQAQQPAAPAAPQAPRQ